MPSTLRHRPAAAPASYSPPMTDFGETIGKAYATEGAAIELGHGRARRASSCPTAQVKVPLRDDEPARADRRRDRHRQDADAAADRRAALGRRRLGLRRRREGRPLRARRRPARPTARRRSARPTSGIDVRADRLPGRVPQRSAASARACRCARPSPTSGRSCSRRCSTRTRRRSRASCSSSTTPTRRACRCSTSSDLRALLTFLDSDAGKAELEGIGGLVVADGRRAAARARRARGRRRQRVLRRAAVRRSHDLLRTAPRRPRRHLVPRAAGRAGQAEALLDRADVAARRAVRGAARGRRPRQAEARASSSTRRTCCSTARRKAFLESVAQTVRLIRSKGVGVFFVTQTPKDIDDGRARAARQPRAARAARVHAGRREGAQRRRCGRSRSRTSTTSSSCSSSSASARRRSRSSPRTACRRRSCTRGSGRRVSRMAPADDVDAAAKASPLYAKYGDARRRAERARAARRAARAAGRRRRTRRPRAGSREHKKAAKARRRRRRRASATSSTRAPASRSSARSCAASSGC